MSSLDQQKPRSIQVHLGISIALLSNSQRKKQTIKEYELCQILEPMSMFFLEKN
jgi:uncharacterized protein Veg